MASTTAVPTIVEPSGKASSRDVESVGAASETRVSPTVAAQEPFAPDRIPMSTNASALKYDFLSFPPGISPSPLPTIEQTPNRFLPNLPGSNPPKQLDQEPNPFDASFGASQSGQPLAESQSGLGFTTSPKPILPLPIPSPRYGTGLDAFSFKTGLTPGPQQLTPLSATLVQLGLPITSGPDSLNICADLNGAAGVPLIPPATETYAQVSDAQMMPGVPPVSYPYPNNGHTPVMPLGAMLPTSSAGPAASAAPYTFPTTAPPVVPSYPPGPGHYPNGYDPATSNTYAPIPQTSYAPPLSHSYGPMPSTYGSIPPPAYSRPPPAYSQDSYGPPPPSGTYGPSAFPPYRHAYANAMASGVDPMIAGPIPSSGRQQYPPPPRSPQAAAALVDMRHSQELTRPRSMSTDMGKSVAGSVVPQQSEPSVKGNRKRSLDSEDAQPIKKSPSKSRKKAAGTTANVANVANAANEGGSDDNNVGQSNKTNGKKGGKKEEDMDPEEKRKTFLERNRQGKTTKVHSPAHHHELIINISFL